MGVRRHFASPLAPLQRSWRGERLGEGSNGLGGGGLVEGSAGWERDVRKTWRAREFRKTQTPAERAAWEILRNRRLLGRKFRRQHPLCGFIVDFYCPTLNLVLEINGDVHTHPAQVDYDRHRTAVLEDHGLTVIRITNDDVNEATLQHLITPLLPPGTPKSPPEPTKRVPPLQVPWRGGQGVRPQRCPFGDTNRSITKPVG